MKHRIALLILLALTPALCLAQGRWFFRGGATQALQLFEDISLLQRIVPLQLTDPQLDGVLKLYEQHPEPVETEDAEAIRKLTEIKQRLLAGTPLVATDQATMRDLMQQMGRNRRAAGAVVGAPPGTVVQVVVGQDEAGPLSPLEQGLWDLLSQTQRAALLGDVRQAAANNQKADQAMGQRAIRAIGEMLPLEEPQWLPARDRLAAALAGGAGPAGSPGRDNCGKMFVEFLDRLRKMPQADFAARQDELAAELLALMPPGASLIVALAEYDTKLIHAAMAGTFLHPRAPALLAELKAARAQ